MTSLKQRQVSQTLTQVLLDRKFMATSELRELVVKLNTKFDYNLDIKQDRSLDEYIGTMNISLARLHLKIVQTRDESTGERLIVLCNTLASNLSLHPELSEQQMALFRTLVERIATASDGHIPHHQALYAVCEIPNCKLSEAQAEQTINELISFQPDDLVHNILTNTLASGKWYDTGTMAEVTWEVSLLQGYVYALHNSNGFRALCCEAL
ncbi:uncharacterized protein LOC111262277 isoform X2 [Varroa jacobsoni]|uniref:uncharacterized protein LOC111262277 isoform X2 n=1 Tax=Varroa jacobsoni TaxID=62625 RepID=UPI000BF25A2A|nr:uncharacterized protein LOC111262277 isoform X2 [Varroa jacobsoni]